MTIVTAVPRKSQGAEVASVKSMPSIAAVPPVDVISLAQHAGDEERQRGHTVTGSRSVGLA